MKLSSHTLIWQFLIRGNKKLEKMIGSRVCVLLGADGIASECLELLTELIFLLVSVPAAYRRDIVGCSSGPIANAWVYTFAVLLLQLSHYMLLPLVVNGIINNNHYINNAGFWASDLVTWIVSRLPRVTGNISRVSPHSEARYQMK